MFVFQRDPARFILTCTSVLQLASVLQKPGTNAKDKQGAAAKALQDKWDSLGPEKQKLIGSFEQFVKDEARRQKQ